MEENYDFRIFGQLDLAKSCGDKEDEENWEIEGVILEEVEDVSGETPVLKAMDWSYFDEHGVIKYEHDPRNKAGRPMPTPVNIIGVPHIREERDNKVFFKGALFPEQPMAQETRRLIKAFKNHSKKYPQYGRMGVGISIEGNYIKKSLIGKRRYAGKVFNMVMTPNPQGTTTYTDMARKSVESFAKSLEVGPTETDLSKKKQGQAIQEEVINKKPKVTAEDIGGGKKAKKKFKNYDEAYRFYRKKYRPVEADKLAKQHFNKE